MSIIMFLELLSVSLDQLPLGRGRGMKDSEANSDSGGVASDARCSLPAFHECCELHVGPHTSLTSAAPPSSFCKLVQLDVGQVAESCAFRKPLSSGESS